MVFSIFFFFFPYVFIGPPQKRVGRVPGSVFLGFSNGSFIGGGGGEGNSRRARGPVRLLSSVRAVFNNLGTNVLLLLLLLLVPREYK